MSVSRILDLVRTGTLTPTQGAMLIQLRQDLAHARERKAFWGRLLPLRNFIARVIA